MWCSWQWSRGRSCSGALEGAELGLLACSCGKGISRSEVEHWTSKVTTELQAITKTVKEKLEECRSKMRKKDETIKRLYWKLQCMELFNGNVTCLRTDGQVNQSPLANQRSRASIAGTIPAAIGSPSLSGRVLTAGEGILPQSSIAGIVRGSGRVGSLSPVRSASAMDRALPSRTRRNSGDPAGAATCNNPALSLGATTAQPLASPQQAQSRQLRGRDGPERVQIVHLRQEVTQLRRQNADLSEQVRARDVQVDNLTGMVREMQQTAQRQLGLFKRQANLREDTLHAMQDELLLSRACSGPAAGDSVVVPPRSPTAAASCSSRALLAPTAETPLLHQQAVVAGTAPSSRNTGAPMQVSRSGKKAADGCLNDRGSSVTRSSSVLARHKDQAVARRIGPGSQPNACAGQSIRAFSPRHGQLQQPQQQQQQQQSRQVTQPSAAQPSSTQVHEVEGLRRMSLAQATQGGINHHHGTVSSPMAPGRTVGNGSLPGTRSSSVEVRARTRINTLRRAQRRQ